MSRVGQFFGKLFAGQSGSHGALLRAYGKLPFYAEYRRLEVAPGVPTAFSQWLDEGRLAWVRGQDEGVRGTMRTSRIALRWPETREWVVASVWESRDSLGRQFPFALFIVCPADALGNDRFQRCVSCLAIHEEFDRLHGRLSALGSGGDFYRLYAKLTLATRLDDLAARTRALAAQARQITLTEWFSQTGLSGMQPGAWFGGLLRRAGRWVGQAGAAGDLALSCPLARGTPYGMQALLWLEWLSSLRPFHKSEPSLILPTASAPDPPRLQIIFRNLLTADFQLMTTDAASYGYIEDLGRPPAAGGEDDPADVAAPAGSLLEALLRAGS
ncbi:MAG: TagF domain-containing protein [Phycisphaerae bacterium]|jgi:hypothetical protein